jgi:DHA1 family tetracycline resistance protein-like MFS transporter
MQFLMSPVLGSLSDRFGRRPVLLTSLLGAGLDFIVMALAPNLWILFLGRIVSGMTGAGITVASSYMADISDDSTRAANFGMIGAGIGLGFIIGPVLGGLFGNLGPLVPFWVAAALNIINFAFGIFVLPESLPPEKRRQIRWSQMNPFVSIVKVLKPSPVLGFILVYFFIYLAGQVHPSIWTLYTQLKFKWTAFEVGLSLSFVGVTIAFAQGYLTRIFIPKWGEYRSLLYALYINIGGFALFAFATQGWMMYAVMVVTCLSGLGGPALQSLISREVPSQEQGELQGSLISLASITAIIGPLFYTDVFARFTKENAIWYFPGMGYLAASIVSCLALLIFFKVGKKPVYTSARADVASVESL